MQIRIDIEIGRPRGQTWALFTDASRLKEWQATLQSFAPVSGEPGQVGSVTRFIYREGGRDVEMLETIVAREEGRVLAQRLEADMMRSVMRNVFSSPHTESTRWSLECDIEFRGVWKLLGVLARPLLVRKTRDDMERFRRLAEGDTQASQKS